MGRDVLVASTAVRSGGPKEKNRQSSRFRGTRGLSLPLLRYLAAPVPVRRGELPHELAESPRGSPDGILSAARRLDDAMDWAHAALEIEPTHLVALHHLAFALKEQQRYDEATARLEEAVELSRRRPFYLGLLGHLYGVVGNRNAAEAARQELLDRATSEYVSSLAFAWIDLGLGNADAALGWFERSQDEGQGPLHLFAGDSVYDCIRSTERFRNVLARAGLGRWAEI